MCIYISTYIHNVCIYVYIYILQEEQSLCSLEAWQNIGGWKVDGGTTQLHARILRGKGAQKKNSNKITVRGSTSATLVLPVYMYICIYVCTCPCTYIYI